MQTANATQIRVARFIAEAFYHAERMADDCGAAYLARVSEVTGIDRDALYQLATGNDTAITTIEARTVITKIIPAHA